MDYLAGTFPNLCRVEVIGKSAEGRKIKLLSITSGGDNKPAIWIDGGLHAREWISPASATYIQQQLVELRDNHEQLLQKYDWYILPVANPDGYEYTRNKDRLWRKSRHRYQSCVGVDLNRNFGYQWKSSRGCRREDYSGPSPFSEPETRAIRDYILAHKNIKAYISLHSYSQMWLIPWGYTDEKPKDYYEIYLPAEKAVEAIKKVRGTEYLLGTPAELLYTSQGSSDDWAKGSAGIDYAYTIELPDTGDYGFVLPSSQIKPVGHELWTGIKAFAESLPL
ncbi:hypothetical protein AAG570_003774 [Ranatra chinensis]|uniref:Peptidase M14 domain-containing protein n=1 Tax=Ranatra chinensis TaxID=642074 RepID=A0ABD0YT47_9HEMI